MPHATTLSELTYEEAMELAYFGAKVIHPRTLEPALKKGIPILIKNTFRPDAPGTKIHGARNSSVVKGFATIDGICLVNIEGSGMMGVPGIAARAFQALMQVNLSVVMISQASSEHSICLAVPSVQGVPARDALRDTFASEISKGRIRTVELIEDQSILAAIGEGMVHKPGVAGRLLTGLGRAGVSVRAIAQGSSERNISVVVERKDSTRALRAVHANFYLSDQTLSVGLVGPGLIGRAFLGQMHAQRDWLRSHHSVDLRLRGIAGSKRMLLGEDCRPGSELDMPQETDLDKLASHVKTESIPHAVIIDCTASVEVSRRYASWLRRGIHVITPNKKAGSGPYDEYREIRSSSRGEARFYYEATVGAGLPVIATLKDLVKTGDEILEIEGVLSGTLSHIFNSLSPESPFSSIVKSAREMGYTEPDPRDDLSGQDVARKLLILAREMGLAMELKDIPVQSLIPKSLLDAGVEDFLSGLSGFDEEMEGLRARESERGRSVPDGPSVRPDRGQRQHHRLPYETI